MKVRGRGGGGLRIEGQADEGEGGWKTEDGRWGFEDWARGQGLRKE